jgi:hypothetical protein
VRFLTMADLDELQTQFASENGLFKTACADTLRIVSILSLESTDIMKPRHLQPMSKNYYEKMVFFGRFLYMIFIKGFTPTVFDILPYSVWRALTVAIYIYKIAILPFILRLTGYGRYASWDDIGTHQPAPTAPESKVPKTQSLVKTGPLSKTNFGDKDYERLITKLYEKTTHLSPHSQSPGNPFSHVGFPGNFFDHLTGVYKILMAWKQPIYIVRAGLYHSLYGTFDYRYGMFDLREGRDEMRSIVGAGSEELAFALCTSDRMGLLMDLYKTLYGDKPKIPTATSASEGENEDSMMGGNIHPVRIAELTAQGYPVRNHITQKVHIFPSEFFASFILVTIADFMEQGFVSMFSTDLDVCLFQFLRYAFFNDLIMFVKPYLRVMPPVFEKYMGNNVYVEANRKQILVMKSTWRDLLHTYVDQREKSGDEFQFVFRELGEEERKICNQLIKQCPYLPEPRIILASTLPHGDKQRVTLAKESIGLLEEWGMMTIKSAGVHGLKEVLNLLEHLMKN